MFLGCARVSSRSHFPPKHHLYRIRPYARCFSPSPMSHAVACNSAHPASEHTETQPKPVSDVEVESCLANYKDLLHSIGVLSTQLGLESVPRLVAVSKTKPVELIKALYDAGHRDFGENYIQELVTKAPELPSDIRWRFIGHLQSNKVNKLCSVPNIEVVETVDSLKLAKTLSKHFLAKGEKKLQIFIQVNTSNEPQKSGISPDEVIAFAKELIEDKDNLYTGLVFKGLMTIGELDGDATQDFKRLAECRTKVAEALRIPEKEIELSMGMSGDYKLAIQLGSTNVRVGSTIFGARHYKK